MAPIPWRNGAGATRELASVEDSTGAVLWRVSLADLDKDAQFSSFDRMDRLFVALGELRLTVDGGLLHLRSGEQTRFPGEASTSVALDRPTQALNVMTRRDVYRADVVQRPAFEPMTHGARVTVILGGLAADVLLTSPAKVSHD